MPIIINSSSLSSSLVYYSNKQTSNQKDKQLKVNKMHRPFHESPLYNQFLSYLFFSPLLWPTTQLERQTTPCYLRLIVHLVKHIDHQFLFLCKHVVVLFYSPPHSSFLPFSGSREPINSTRACRLLTKIRRTSADLSGFATNICFEPPPQSHFEYVECIELDRRVLRAKQNHENLQVLCRLNEVQHDLKVAFVD